MRIAGASKLIFVSVLTGVVAVSAAARAVESAAAPAPADVIVASLEPPLAELATEVLERNPEVARLRAAAAAAEARAPQARSLPDPMASVTAFLMPPQTRVGPQQAAVSVSQRFPWWGKLELREREALLGAEAARAAVEAKRLALVTETRRLADEVAFLAAQQSVLGIDRATLVHYEELARARYASGVGLEQSVVKLQTEITRDDDRLLEVASRRATLVAELDTLRDRPVDVPLPTFALGDGDLPAPSLDRADLRARALELRPEVAAAKATIATAAVGVDLAKRASLPDLTLGIGYAFVGKRQDAAGRAAPPPDNGDDDLGLTFGVDLPIWRHRIAAGVAESTSRSTGAEEELRAVVASIDGELSDLVSRLPLVHQQLDLFEDVLSAQAEEALRSAESGYAAGSASALDLLDAERVLLEVRIATARSRADYDIAWSRLEGAVGAPLASAPRGGAQ